MAVIISRRSSCRPNFATAPAGVPAPPPHASGVRGAASCYDDATKPIFGTFMLPLVADTTSGWMCLQVPAAASLLKHRY